MKKTLWLSALALSATSAMAQHIQYPAAPKDGTVDEYFGVRVPDPFRPLENDTSAETRAWVEAENAVTAAYLGKIPFRSKLMARLKAGAN